MTYPVNTAHVRKQCILKKSKDKSLANWDAYFNFRALFMKNSGPGSSVGIETG
jgi:hypothetical protein